MDTLHGIIGAAVLVAALSLTSFITRPLIRRLSKLDKDTRILIFVLMTAGLAAYIAWTLM